MNKSFSLPFLFFEDNKNVVRSVKNMKSKNKKKIFISNNISKKFENLLLTNYEKNKQRIKLLLKNKKINVLKVKENLKDSKFYNRKSEIYSILFSKKEPSKDIKKKKQRKRIFQSMKLSTKNIFTDNFDIFKQIQNFKGKNVKEKYSLLKKNKINKKSIIDNRRSFKKKIINNKLLRKKNLSNFKIKKIDLNILNKSIMKNFCDLKIKKISSSKNIFKNKTFSLEFNKNPFMNKKEKNLKPNKINIRKIGKIFMSSIKKNTFILKKKKKIFKKKTNLEQSKRLIKIKKFIQDERKNYLKCTISYNKIKDKILLRIKNKKSPVKRKWMKIINNLLNKSNLRFVNKLGYYKSLMIKVPDKLLKSKSIYKHIEIMQYKLKKDVKDYLIQK